MRVPWRCGVCEGLNQGGSTCAVCGASQATAIAVDQQPATRPQPSPEPRSWHEPALPVPEAPGEPPRRGLLARLIDAAARTVERALAAPSPPAEEPLEPEPPPRRRSRLQVRPFPFGLMVTWRSDDEEHEL